MDLQQHLRAILSSLLEDKSHLRRLVIALSGGLDSMVLLHACFLLRDQIPADLCAVHINHGLNPSASDWTAHCMSECAQRSIPLRVIDITVDRTTGIGTEAAARNARYQAFSDMLRADDVLLTAHHSRDQGETVLLNLLRGSGPRGLSGMPVSRPLSNTFLLRPLLDVAHQYLVDFALQHQLRWVDDSSNFQTHFSRNYLRQKVIPLLAERWPDWAEQFSWSARYCHEADDVLQGLLADKLTELQSEEGGLSVAGLSALSADLRRQLLRHWLWRNTGHWPPRWLTDELTGSVVNAAVDRQPVLPWLDWELRRFNNELLLVKPLPDPPPLPENGLNWQASVDGRFGTLMLPANGSLRLFRRASGGLVLPENPLRVTYRSEGLMATLPGRPRRTLKKILQESRVAPWLRDRTPLIWCGDELVWICGVGACAGFNAAADQAGWAIDWQLPESLDD